MTYRCMFFYLFFTSKPCDAPELSLQWCHLFYLFSLPSWPHPIIWYSIDSIYTLMIPDLQPKPLSWTPNSYGVFYLTYYYIFLNFYYFIDILLHSIYFVPGTELNIVGKEMNDATYSVRGKGVKAKLFHW